VCPVDCIPVDPQRRETREQLLAKYRRLQAEAGPGPGADAVADAKTRG